MKNEINTYLGIDIENNGEIHRVEFDLVSIREKGVEDKYFTITVPGGSVSMNESDLIAIKEYFNQISWNV